VLGEQDAEICAKYWNVRGRGNVDPELDAHDDFMLQVCKISISYLFDMANILLETKNVLAAVQTPTQLSQAFGIDESTILSKLAEAKQKLRKYRDSERPRPSLDDKLITGWNGLAIGSLSRLAGVLESLDLVKSKAYLQKAIDAAEFLKSNVYNQSTRLLKRVYREGTGDTPGFADDYAFLIQGLLYLYDLSALVDNKDS